MMEQIRQDRKVMPNILGWYAQEYYDLQKKNQMGGHWWKNL
jgi:hypothetical protein